MDDISTAEVVDTKGAAVAVCDLQFHQYGGRKRFAGRARTVRCRDDNALIRIILSEVGNEQVLIVDGGASLSRALVGDNMAAEAVANGWAGVVVNGAVRDVVGLELLDLGVTALGHNPRRSDKAGGGLMDVEVTFGGATFVPGAEVYSDEDGVVVVTE